MVTRLDLVAPGLYDMDLGSIFTIHCIKNEKYSKFYRICVCVFCVSITFACLNVTF